MNLNRPKFEIFDHTADLGLVVEGTDLKKLFQNKSHVLMRKSSA